MYYRIVDWDKHYEVDDKGAEWEPGHGFRMGPLKYLRIKCRREWNTRLIRLRELAGENMWLSLGVFEKLCQMVGSERRAERQGGIIRNCEGEPATAADIQDILMLEPKTWDYIVALLSHPRVNWIKVVQTSGDTSEPTKGCDDVPPAATRDLLEPPKPQFALWNRREHQEAPRPPGDTGPVPESLEPPRNPLSRQVNTSQLSRVESKTTQEKTTQSSREGEKRLSAPRPQPQGTCGLYDVAPYRLPDASGGKFDGDSPGVSLDSTRLGFTCRLRQILHPANVSDIRALSNLEQWLYEQVTSGRASPQLSVRIRELAEDCVHGDKPMAVFMARAKRELGYTPPSRQGAAL